MKWSEGWRGVAYLLHPSAVSDESWTFFPHNWKKFQLFLIFLFKKTTYLSSSENTDKLLVFLHKSNFLSKIFRIFFPPLWNILCPFSSCCWQKAALHVTFHGVAMRPRSAGFYHSYLPRGARRPGAAGRRASSGTAWLNYAFFRRRRAGHGRRGWCASARLEVEQEVGRSRVPGDMQRHTLSNALPHTGGDGKHKSNTLHSPPPGAQTSPEKPSAPPLGSSNSAVKQKLQNISSESTHKHHAFFYLLYQLINLNTH